MKINVIGTIFGLTGYDSHTRSLVNALYPLADVRLSTQLIPGWESQCNDAELNMIMKQGKETDTTLIITTPHNWKLYTGLGINMGYCVWEGDSVPVSYIDEMLNPNIHFILVPSEHTKTAIIRTFFQGQNTQNKSGYPEQLNRDEQNFVDKIKIIPHGVDSTLFYPIAKKEDNKFTFICNKGWRGTLWDRGGVQYVIKAFAEEFKDEEKVELLVKLNPAYMPAEILNQSITQLQLPPHKCKIHVNLENIPFNKLVNLYNQADVFVCATRCEAFNLPGLEAMSCGLPTIQTNFGGQLDYMTDDNSLFIQSTLEEVKEDIMYEEIKWAVPDMEDLKLNLRWAYDNQDKIKEKGLQALEDSKKFTWDNSAKKILNILE